MKKANVSPRFRAKLGFTCFRISCLPIAVYYFKGFKEWENMKMGENAFKEKGLSIHFQKCKIKSYPEVQKYLIFEEKRSFLD